MNTEDLARVLNKEMEDAFSQARIEHQKILQAKGGAVQKKVASQPKFAPEPDIAVKSDLHAMMKAQEEWLEKTQHMRVVALNEACEVAKEYIGHGESMSGTEIVRMAHMFASFLIDGKS